MQRSILRSLPVAMVAGILLQGPAQGSPDRFPGPYQAPYQDPNPYPDPNQGPTQNEPPGPPQEATGGPQGGGPSGEAYAMESPQQLQQLVAPIALYPDALVASILAASSFPAEIAQANAWLAPRETFSPEELASAADQQSWDPSVKALLPFPPVLHNLASNLPWTSELGDAYYNQQPDVMDAIQEMRREAKKAGTLKSNHEIKVIDKHGYISIEPASPHSDEVYVPAYDPWDAYGMEMDPWPGWVEVPGAWWGGPGLSFGIGFGIGPFLGYGWGWNRWDMDWYNRSVYFGGAPYFGRGPAFFNRYNYYHGYPGFARRMQPDPRIARGFDRGGGFPGRTRSGIFSGFSPGGMTRTFSARGQSSFGGGFHGGGFGGGGFRGFGGGGFRGGGFHGGGGRR